MTRYLGVYNVRVASNLQFVCSKLERPKKQFSSRRHPSGQRTPAAPCQRCAEAWE